MVVVVQPLPLAEQVLSLERANYSKVNAIRLVGCMCFCCALMYAGVGQYVNEVVVLQCMLVQQWNYLSLLQYMTSTKWVARKLSYLNSAIVNLLSDECIL